ncbi:MAG: 2-oxoacid:acceptor oxidoreductase family protein, partial [Thaumarchaeota archaeon]|nr:2-oxoacid:acceptor oxidoreductase family protein [Nitrososphaerota archaeon]
MKWTEFLLAGQGGQGVVELGNYIAYDAILRGLQAASMSSYGPEMRSGKVKCYVITADTEIVYPVAETPDILVVMNALSLDFEPDLEPEGLMIINSNIVHKQPARTDIKVLKVPASDLVDRLREEAVPMQGLLDPKVLANSVLFGAIKALQAEPLDLEHLTMVYRKALGETK